MTDSIYVSDLMRLKGGMGLGLGPTHMANDPVGAQILNEKLMFEYGMLSIVMDMIGDLKNKAEELEISIDAIKLQINER